MVGDGKAGPIIRSSRRGQGLKIHPAGVDNASMPRVPLFGVGDADATKIGAKLWSDLNPSVGAGTPPPPNIPLFVQTRVAKSTWTLSCTGPP